MNCTKKRILFYSKVVLWSFIITLSCNAANTVIDDQPNNAPVPPAVQRAPHRLPHTIKSPTQTENLAQTADKSTTAVTQNQERIRTMTPTKNNSTLQKSPSWINHQGEEPTTPGANLEKTDQRSASIEEIKDEQKTDSNDTKKEDTPLKNDATTAKDEPNTDTQPTPASKAIESKEESPATQVNENKQDDSTSETSELKKENAASNQTDNNEEPTPAPAATTSPDTGTSEKGGSSSNGMFTAAGMTALATGVAAKMVIQQSITKTGEGVGTAGGSVKEHFTGNLKQQKEFRKGAEQNIATQEKLIQDRHSQAKRKVRFYTEETKKGTPGSAEKLEKWKANLQKAEKLRNDISTQKGLITKDPSKHLTAEQKHSNDIAHIKLSKNVMSEEQNRLKARLNKYDQKAKLTPQQLIKQKDTRKGLREIEKNTYSDETLQQKEKQVKVLKKQNPLLKKTRRTHLPLNKFTRRK
jgi:hypothetical protein